MKIGLSCSKNIENHKLHVHHVHHSSRADLALTRIMNDMKQIFLKEIIYFSKYRNILVVVTFH